MRTSLDRTRSARRAFSMIELLVAVIILGVGLLGLAISLPATISIQRTGGDRTQGVSAARAARAYLSTRPDLARAYETGTGFSTGSNNQVGFGAMLSNDGSPGTGSWSVDHKWAYIGEYVDAPSGPFAAGTINIYNDSLSSSGVILSVADRLHPAGESGSDPRFIWDLVARRLPGKGLGVDRQVQVAVFVRRIDQQIRLGETTLYTAIAKPTPGEVQAAACAVDDVSAGRVMPRNDGDGEYARPILVDVMYDEEEPDRIKLSSTGFGGNAATTRLAMSQAGQRLVDNLGNVYRVLRVDEEEDDVLIIDPPVPAWARSSNAPSSVPLHQRLRQIAFVPQIPVAVEVFDITLSNAVTNTTGTGVKP